MKQKKNLILLAISISTLLITGNLLAQNNNTGQQKLFGTQKWTTANLNVSSFANGDSIFEARSAEEWEKAGVDQKPVWCNYDNDPNNGAKYGKLYNWYSVNDPRGLAPKG